MLSGFVLHLVMMFYAEIGWHLFYFETATLRRLLVCWGTCNRLSSKCCWMGGILRADRYSSPLVDILKNQLRCGILRRHIVMAVDILRIVNHAKITNGFSRSTPCTLKFCFLTSWCSSWCNPRLVLDSLSPVLNHWLLLLEVISCPIQAWQNVIVLLWNILQLRE